MKTDRSSFWSGLAAELRRRNVYPVIAAYAVFGWILLQVGEVTFEPLGLPGWTMTALIILVVLGFPVVLALSWLFQLTPTGLRYDRASVPCCDDDGPSIAVLPFVDMSPEQDQDYFCEGVADEILNALSRIRQLNVSARAASFRYREGSVDIRRIGKELRVRSLLTGSVRKSERRIRVTAQLVNIADGFHLWSKTFDEELKDIFAIQDEIATSIAAALLETISPKEQSAIKTTSSKDVIAYEYYLRGRQFFNRLRKTDIEFARHMFRQAIKIDSEFALAWAGYADCHSFLVMYSDPNASYRAQADSASERALRLNPDLAEAHASRGLAHLVSHEFKQAEAEFNKALKLNPRLFEAYYFYGRTRFHQGDTEMAAKLFEKAAEVNPTDYQSRMLRVQILRGSGRIQEASTEAKEAIEVVEKHLEWHPDDVRALQLGAGSLIVLGQVERAKRWLRRALEIDPNDSVLLYNVACSYATLGLIDDALESLEQAVRHGMVNLDWMRADKDLIPLRGHRRFKSLLEQLEQTEQLTDTAA